MSLCPFAFPMKTGVSLRSICNFAYLLTLPEPAAGEYYIFPSSFESYLDI